MTSDYKADLGQADAELRELLNQRERLDIEIAKKRMRIAALSMLADDSEETDQRIAIALGGLTDEVLSTFRSAHPKALTPTDVRDRLEKIGFPVGGYKNVLAAIHTVISRLHDGRKIAPMKNEQGETAFAYNAIPSDHPVNKLRAPRPPASIRKRLGIDSEKSPGEQIKDLQAIRDKYRK